MNISSKNIILLFISISFSTEFDMISKQNNLNQFPVIEMPYIDNNQKLLEDENNVGQLGIPLRFSEKIDVNYNTSNSGEWFNYNDNFDVWRLNIVSNDAIGLKLFFNQFQLSKNALLYIYDEFQDMIIGPITSNNNHADNTFSHKLLKGPSIFIEYFVPTTYLGEHQLQISRVYHAYRDIHGFYETRDRNCGENVACSSQDYEDQVNSVIYLEMYQYICSAALINNTSQDLIPYVLTAQHCLDSETEVGEHNSFTFYFNHQSSSCGNSSGYYGQNKTGSYLRSEDSYTDFALLEMDNSPNSSWNPYFSGWSRSSTTPTISSGIHHPGGAPKKINYDNNPAGNSGWAWTITWDQGGTEGGSSGSPAFDDDGYIIGQLYGGNVECGGTDYYGKFSSSWSGSNSESRLVDWLDPENSGVYSLGGTYDGCISGLFDCNGICDGNAVEDCNGECGGNAEIDECGTCDSDFLNNCVQDCAGTWGGNAVEDVCGICNGDGSCLNADIYLDNPTFEQIEVYVNNEIPIAGFQFEVTSNPNCIILENTFGGEAANSGFTVSNANGIVLGFSLDGETIQPGENLLTNLLFESSCDCSICIDNIVLTNSDGIELNTNDNSCTDITNLILGDINQDYIINISDIVLLVAIILEDYSPTDIENNLSDINNDGVVNVVDVVMLVEIIIN